MHTLGRLLRLSLLPSAVADVTVGMLLGGAGVWPEGVAPGLLVLSSLGIYHGSMALNDWADRAEDEETRPDRPIPSGAISPGLALLVAVLLICGGLAAAWLSGAAVGLWMSAVAACAVTYDLRGRGPTVGPLLLGLCRFGNLGAGILAAQVWSGRDGVELAWFLPAVLYGAYVFLLSRLARLEDQSDGALARVDIRRVALVALTPFLALPISAAFLPTAPGMLSVAACAFLCGIALRGPLAYSLPRTSWGRPEIGKLTGMLLRRLLMFTAAACLLLLDAVEWGSVRVEGYTPILVALFVLGGYPLAHGLRRIYPPT